MSTTTGIEWTDATWNPVTGCTEVSSGCEHCYARTFAERFRGTPGHYFQRGFDPTLRPDKLTAPLHWRRPRRVFVNSMSDLFHHAVPDEYIARVFAVMATTPRHTYQLLTKRHGRMRSLLSSEAFAVEVCAQVEDLGGYHDGLPLPNLWLGVSVEDQPRAELRIPALGDTPAAVRFLSCEPLLGPVDLTPWLGTVHRCPGELMPPGSVPARGHTFECCTNPGLDWVIVGGESGPDARPMELDWAAAVITGCQTARVPVFCKQLGSVWARQHGGDPKGGDWTRWPAELQVRQYPGREAPA